MRALSKAIVILSAKSAGSTALQTLLCRYAGGRHAAHTRHREMETLYWIKAAAMLGMPEIDLPDSELPIPREQAERELRHFISENAPGFAIPTDPESAIFSGWHELCVRHAPVFVEKSPHHLYQWSSLELLERVAREMKDIDHRFIGLVRNPMDVLYSAWCRWRTPPEVLQQYWRMAYENLRRSQPIMGDRLTVVRYEDLTSDPSAPRQLMTALGLTETQPGADRFMVMSSIMKWKKDPLYGFQLDPAVAQTARFFGYEDHELHNAPRAGWRRHRVRARMAHRACVVPWVALRQRVRHLLK